MTSGVHDEQSAGAVGWIGLGEMGLPMASNLRSAGFRVIGFDLSPVRCEAAVLAGLDVADSLPGLLGQVSVLITMLRTGDQTAALLLGPDGVAASRTGPLDVVMMSTTDPVSVARLAEECSKFDLTVVDAPVSGGVTGATGGTLSIMASGDPAAMERVIPILRPLGKTVHRLGDRPGAGQAAKQANQVMMVAAIAGVNEGLELASGFGADRGSVIAAVLDGTGASWPLANWDLMRSLWENYSPDGPLANIEKDLRAIIDPERGRQAELPVAELAFERLSALHGKGREGPGLRRR